MTSPLEASGSPSVNRLVVRTTRYNTESIWHRAWPTGRAHYTGILVLSSGTITLGFPGSVSAQLLPEGNTGCGITDTSDEGNQRQGLGLGGGGESSSHRSAAGGPSERVSGPAAPGRRWAGAGAACSARRWPAAGSSWPGGSRAGLGGCGTGTDSWRSPSCTRGHSGVCRR